jgi:hypothetical protein
VQAKRQPVSDTLFQHLEAQPVGLDELGLQIRPSSNVSANPITAG